MCAGATRREQPDPAPGVVPMDQHWAVGTSLSPAAHRSGQGWSMALPDFKRLSCTGVVFNRYCVEAI